MGKRHMKTITAPVSWPIDRKKNKFIIRPNPGKSFEMSIPLALVFKKMLKSCKTLKEVKYVLNENEILVDGKRRKDPKYPLGIMEVISIPKLKQDYRLLINMNKKLYLLPINEKEAKLKVCKIEGKTLLKGGKTQLNLFDGRNMIVKDKEYVVGDSVLLEMPSQKIKDHFKIEKGNYAFLTGGSHTGDYGEITNTDEKKGVATIKTKKETFETPIKFVFVVGNKGLAITLEK